MLIVFSWLEWVSFFSPSHLMLYDKSISLSDNYDIWQWHYQVFVLCRFFSFTLQIPSSFFKIVCYLTNAVFVLITLGSVRPIFPSQESLFVLLRHSTSMIVLGGSTMVSDCCSCFEVSNTLTHLFRGVFNRVGGIFIAGMGNYSECSWAPALFNTPLVHHT